MGWEGSPPTGCGAATGEADNLSGSLGSGKGGLGHRCGSCSHGYGVLVGVQVTVGGGGIISGEREAGVVVGESNEAPLGIGVGFLPGAAEESPEESHSLIALMGLTGTEGEVRGEPRISQDSS